MESSESTALALREEPRPREKEYEITVMHHALKSITDEIRRFVVSEEAYAVPLKTSIAENKNNSIDIMKSKYKSKLKYKKQLVAKLRKDLNSACILARILISHEKKETSSLTSQLAYARSECVDLLKRYNNNLNMISNLHQQNENVHEKHKKLANFIQLAYTELKKIQCDLTEEPSTLAQLKKLIECCGQYYANYKNESETCLRMKQKSRFLKNKISILENNIQAIRDQLDALEYRNLRLKAENNQLRANNTRALGVSCSDVKIKQGLDREDADVKHCQDSGDTKYVKVFDLSTHLEIVKSLLSDQDSLLRDLNVLSKATL